MNKQSVKKVLRISNVNEQYFKVNNFKHKFRGTDGNGNPITFSKADQAKIKAGASKLAKDVLKINI